MENINSLDVKQTGWSQEASHQSGSGVINPTKSQEHLLKMSKLNEKIGRPLFESWKLTDTINKLMIESPKTMIDLDPFYQRKDVWPDKKRKEFLNSLFLSSPINNIILVHYFTDGNGNKFYRTMDGKQRLTCVKKFIQDGTLVIDLEESVPFGWYNLTYQQICRNLNTINLFNNVSVDVSIYDTTNLTEEDSLDWESWAFKILNAGLSLNDAEKRNANQNELNEHLKDIYLSLNKKDRLYTKSISEDDRYKNKDIIEKVFYQAYTEDWFSIKITPAVMNKFQELNHDSNTLDRIRRNFHFIHTIMVENENLNKFYWKTKTDKKGNVTYTKTKFCAPLNNLDLLVYGMSLLTNLTKTEVKTKFDNMVSYFFYYMNVYQTQRNDLSPEHIKLIENFINHSSKGSNSTGLKRKTYLDYLFSIVS